MHDRSAIAQVGMECFVVRVQIQEADEHWLLVETTADLV